MSDGSILRRSLGPLAAATLTAALLLVGCGDDATAPGPDPLPQGCDPADSVVCDFALADVNPGSATYNQLVSPRQFQGRISAWYFGHAT